MEVNSSVFYGSYHRSKARFLTFLRLFLIKYFCSNLRHKALQCSMAFNCESFVENRESLSSNQEDLFKWPKIYPKILKNHQKCWILTSFPKFEDPKWLFKKYLAEETYSMCQGTLKNFWWEKNHFFLWIHFTRHIFREYSIIQNFSHFLIRYWKRNFNRFLSLFSYE